MKVDFSHRLYQRRIAILCEVENNVVLPVYNLEGDSERVGHCTCANRFDNNFSAQQLFVKDVASSRSVL